jgi:hypothetical protein
MLRAVTITKNPGASRIATGAIHFKGTTNAHTTPGRPRLQ